MKRAVLSRPLKPAGNYFTQPKNGLDFIQTGSTLLDLAMGGGWARRRVGNVIGDASTGKTLLMIEACANFARATKRKCKINYRERERAFDEPYAEALGMPLELVDFDSPTDTVEDLFLCLQDTIKRAKKDKLPTLEIVDSLDSLTDKAEKDRGIEEGTYGAAKAKQMSQLFRRLIRDLADADVTLIFVSQIRDKIGAMFGRKFARTGGKALDFYASQIVILSELGRIDKTVKGIKRKSGLKVKALVDKNKVSLPYREAEFRIMFGYGVDDTVACAEMLAKTGALRVLLQDADKRHQKECGPGTGEEGQKAAVKAYMDFLGTLDLDVYDAALVRLHETTKREWYEIENNFVTKRRKYA